MPYLYVLVSSVFLASLFFWRRPEEPAPITSLLVRDDFLYAEFRNASQPVEQQTLRWLRRNYY